MADDLNTQLVFGANTAGAEAGVRTVKRSLKDLADSAAVAAKSIEGASDQAGKSLAGMGDGAEAAARKIQRDTASMKSSLQRYLSTLEGGSKDSRKYWEAMADFKGVDKNALRPLLDQLDSYNAKTRVAAETTTEWTGSLTKIGAGVAGVAAVAATVGVAAKAMFDASVNAERLRTMLDFSTGGNSAKEIEYLRGVTFRLGLEFNSTAKAYGQFQAAAKGTALEGDKARAVFESVAKASAVMGLSAADTNGVLLALQQMISKGTVQAEELRGQLGERLPGAFQIAAKAMGVTTSELGKMLEQGQVIADDFLPKFGAALEKNLGGAAEKAAERLDAAVNRFDAAWEKLKQKAGDSGVSKAVSQELSAISRDLDAVSDGMDRAGKAGGGMWAQLGSGAAIAVGRVGFSTLNLAANTLNGTINALTGGVFGLRTDLALLPDIFKTDAQYAKALADRLTEAEAKMAALQGTGADTTPNPYIRDSYFQLQEYIKELKKAQAEQAKLTGVPVVGVVNEGIVAQGRAREQYMNQRAKDEEAANKFRLNLAGVPGDYVKDMTELIRLNQAGIIIGDEYTAALKKQQDELLKKTGVTKGATSAATAEQNAYESLIASVRAKIAEDKLELDGGLALTESQKIRIKLDQDLAAGRVKLSAAREKEIRQDIDALAASEAELAARRALNKANIEAGQTREKYLASLSTGIDKIRADIQAQEDATARMGLTKDAVAELDAAKLEMLATDAELQAIKALDRNLDQQTYDSLKEQAKLYRDLAAAKKIGAAKETALDLEKANAEAAKKAAEDWQRASDDINRSLTDALLRGFESGKGFAKNFVDTMKNLFSTLVLRPIISAIVSPVAGAITGALGLAGTANAGTSALGTVGNIASGARLLGGLGAFGGGLSGGFGGLMGSLGLSATGTTLGGALSAGSIALQSGNILGGLGTFAGALGPIALGIGALTSLLGSFKGETRTGGQFGVAFDGSVTNQRRGQTYTIEGQQFDRDFTNGLQTALKDGIAYRLEGDPVAQESAIREAVAGTASGINGFLKALGSAATLTGFSAGLETSGKGRGGVFAGGLLSTGAAFGESGKGDNYAGTLYEAFSTNSPDFKTALENFTLDLKQATIQALQTVSDIPEAVQKLLKGVDAEGLTDDAANKLLVTINAQIVGVNQFKDALKGMGLDTLAALSFDAAAGLAEVSGGFDKLLGNLQTYYTNFFTGEEQRANLQRSLAEQLSTLGLQLPDINATNARDQFRALVSAAEKDMSEAGRKTYATLLALSGAFASITDAAQTTTQTLEQQRQAYYSALQGAVSARNDVLRNQLDAAQEVASTLGDIFDTLRSNVRELYGEVDGTRGMLATQGSAFIDQALAAAKKSGYLPDADKLAEAISAVRGGIDGGAYTTQFASDRDRLVLAGKLAGLEKITEKQLTDAQKTVRALETQIDQNEQVLDYWKQQIDIASGTYDGILSVEAAVQQLSSALGGTGTTKPGGISGMGGGSTPASGTGAIPRASYGADEALTSFEKFKDWYNGIRYNADPKVFMDQGYQVPDWLRVSNFGADDGTDKAQFGSYLFFKNNPQYAKDLEQIYSTGRSSFATDGSTLQRTDLSKLPKDIADYYTQNRNELLATEGFGLDPVLAYQLYNFGPGQFGLDGRKQSFTEWLQNTKWTPDGLVSNNNVVSLAQMGYSNYNLARWQLSSGNIVDRDGTIYTPEGKKVGRATQAQFEEVYGAGAKPTGGAAGAGDDYLTAIKTNIDSAINSGWSAQQLADGLISTGTSLKDVAEAYGISVDQVKENLIAGGATNIPKFDIGTNYVPRDMLAYIHEGEAVVPKAYNPAAGGGGAGSNAELVAEVRALREAVAALQAAANETAGNTRLMPQMGRQFNDVTLGGTAMRQKAVA